MCVLKVPFRSVHGSMVGVCIPCVNKRKRFKRQLCMPDKSSDDGLTYVMIVACPSLALMEFVKFYLGFFI